MPIPQYPDHAFPCDSVDDAIEQILRQGVNIAEHTINHYVGTRDYGYATRGQEIISYNFFTAAGGNIATYHPGLRSLQFQGNAEGAGRAWGIKSPDLVRADIAGNVEYVRRRMALADALQA